ncbi:hypothetical protein Btru_062109 [Bulinus truncatus]|nr:hypothetical protein Btru_062109 [Bulinus truncatus]
MASAVVKCLPLLFTYSLTISAFSLNAPAALRPRILGGLEVYNQCKSPYNSIAALEFSSGGSSVVLCSASIITETILATTAYCVENIKVLGENGLSVVAVVGERDIMGTDVEEQKIPISSFQAHKYYNSTTLDNNIGLIKLAMPVRLGNCVQLATRYEDDPTACTDLDRSCFMAGWGAYTETNAFMNSARLRAADVVVFGEFVSKIMTQTTESPLPTGTLIVEGANTNNKACTFDWGNLITCKRNNKYVLRGLLARDSCKTPDLPMLMLDYPRYQTWVDVCIRNWDSCYLL